jgi:hypothetical protein
MRCMPVWPRPGGCGRCGNGTGIGEDAAVAAVWAYLDAGPVDDTDRDALDAGVEEERTRYMLRRWGREGAPVAALLYQPTTVAALAGVE